MPESPDLLRQRLAEAREAYHQLQLGRQRVSTRGGDGRQVTYTPADAERLARYIAVLERQLGDRQPGWGGTYLAAGG